MRKIWVIFISICVFYSANLSTIESAYASAQTSTYAKVLENCVLYKTPSFEYSIENIYFTIPETYFVTIIDEISDKCYKVQYGRFVGYIKSETVVKATFVPIVKTLDNITLDIKETSGTQIWSYPTSNSTVLTTVSAGTKNLTYIAMTYGSIPSGGESNLWYYVSFTPSFNSTNVYEGYIYSENITNLSDIVANTECNPEIISNDNSTDNVIYISGSMKTILVVIVSVPLILFFIIIMYKLFKKVRKNTNNNLNNENYKFENMSSYNDYEEHREELRESELKHKLNEMKGVSFVKKSNRPILNDNYPYPEFPTYDTEDDLL